MKSIIEYRRNDLERRQKGLENEKKLIKKFEESKKIHINIPTEYELKNIAKSLKRKDNDIFIRLGSAQRLKEWIDYYEHVIDICPEVEFIINPPKILPYYEKIADKVVSPKAIEYAEFIYKRLNDRLEELEKNE